MRVPGNRREGASCSPRWGEGDAVRGCLAAGQHEMGQQDDGQRESKHELLHLHRHRMSLDATNPLRTAIATAFSEARPLPHNTFKVELALRAVFRALLTAGARA